jgi:hypothetical protein
VFGCGFQLLPRCPSASPPTPALIPAVRLEVVIYNERNKFVCISNLTALITLFNGPLIG